MAKSKKARVAETARQMQLHLQAAWPAQVAPPLAAVLFSRPTAAARLWERHEAASGTWCEDRARRLVAFQDNAAKGKAETPGSKGCRSMEEGHAYLLEALIDAALVEVIKHPPTPDLGAQAEALLWGRLLPHIEFLAQRFEVSATKAGLDPAGLVSEAWMHVMADTSGLPPSGRRSGRKPAGHARITCYDPDRRATVATFVDRVVLNKFIDLVARGDLPGGGKLVSLSGPGGDGRGGSLDAEASREMNEQDRKEARIRRYRDAIRHCCGILLRGGYSSARMIAFFARWNDDRGFEEIAQDQEASVGWAFKAVNLTMQRVGELMEQHFPDIVDEFRRPPDGDKL